MLTCFTKENYSQSFQWYSWLFFSYPSVVAFCWLSFVKFCKVLVRATPETDFFKYLVILWMLCQYQNQKIVQNRSLTPITFSICHKESEFWRNPPDPRYIYGCATPWAVALKRPILFRPKLLLHGLMLTTVSWQCPFNMVEHMLIEKKKVDCRVGAPALICTFT
jgi:hypothetical protein